MKNSKLLPYIISGVLGALGVGAQIACNIILDKHMDNLCGQINETTDEAVRRIGDAYRDRKEEIS